MNIFSTSIAFGLLLTFNDIINMSIVKQITLGNLVISWLPIAYILYGLQMLIFYKGLHVTQMSVLNLTWNLFSNIIITMIGIYYFKENINNIESYGLFFAFFALFLFGLAQYQK